MIVRESLSRFDLLNEEFLAENVLNEKIDINLIVNKAKKIGVLSAMFLKFSLLGVNTAPGSLPPKQDIAKDPIILKMAEDDHLSKPEIYSGFSDLLKKYMGEEEKKTKESEIVSAGKPGFIESVNKIKPGRLATVKIPQYDQYDAQILEAVKELRKIGEDPNPDLIKSIMLIETGMVPSKNSLGYEGFPQTKKHIVDEINKRHGTSFSMKDMYNAKESAKFIHYYLKTISKSKYVENLRDLIIAYNWGMGNLGKWKRGESKLPIQTSDYIKMMDNMKKYWVS